jgi:hypothetical protein
LKKSFRLGALVVAVLMVFATVQLQNTADAEIQFSQQSSSSNQILLAMVSGHQHAFPRRQSVKTRPIARKNSVAVSSRHRRIAIVRSGAAKVAVSHGRRKVTLIGRLSKNNRAVAARRVQGRHIGSRPAATRTASSCVPTRTRRNASSASSVHRTAIKPTPRKTVSTAAAPAAKSKYAYALNFFMWSPPPTDRLAMSWTERRRAKSAFRTGLASDYSPVQLTSAGVFDGSEPLRGGIFNRREGIKYVILHSTETGNPAPADRVIHSWNRGMRHPGAQYVVDRDGKIYQTVDPEYGTVHVDIFRTIAGVNNDNSIGIEIVRSGGQKYTSSQLNSVTRLVAYLQARFSVADNHVFGHGQVQPSDRTDPVNFNWVAFGQAKSSLRLQADSKFKQNMENAIASQGPIDEESDRSVSRGDANAEPTGSAQQPSWTLRFCQALFS